jgi:7,8-dihydropterin-6-yl-methyl-4-(beta-D-ribofuranosyl)aminobenzene 5'-phosphate synthase
VAIHPDSTRSPTSSSVDERINAEMSAQIEHPPVEITILYDNNTYDPHLRTAWGFSALVEVGHSMILFDTGGDGAILMGNIANLDIDPASVDIVILSHAHGDHIGGLDDFLTQADQPEIYLLPSSFAKLKARLPNGANLIEVGPGQMLMDGVLTTGEMGNEIPEQSLMIKTSRGYVALTGCAHPGIIEIVERVKELSGEQVYLLVGGFHLKDMGVAEIEGIIVELQSLGVEKVAPTHCTGTEAIDLFESAYGDDFIRAGVGRKIRIDQ